MDGRNAKAPPKRGLLMGTSGSAYLDEVRRIML